MKKKQAHAKIVQWSDEDGVYVGTCPTLFFGGVHGTNEFAVYRELSKVVAQWERYARTHKRTRKTRRAAR